MTKKQLVEQAFYKAIPVGKENALTNKPLKLKASDVAIDLQYDTEIIDYIKGLSKPTVSEIIHNIRCNQNYYKVICATPQNGYYFASDVKDGNDYIMSCKKKQKKEYEPITAQQYKLDRHYQINMDNEVIKAVGDNK